MQHVFEHVTPYIGYVYPNETDFAWSQLIVIYPYITGLVAGAFVISSLHHVFNIRSFAPVSRFALLTALCFMIFAPSPLLFHLGQPTRAFNAVITPHWTSAMAAFGYVAGFYVCLLLLETWFAFRADMVAMSKSKPGIIGKVYGIMTLGSDDVSPRALEIDHKFARILSMIGIPSACGLHGYVGFVFGSLKTREWWSSDLMPVIFLLSAVASGVGLLIVLYVIVSKVRKTTIIDETMRGLLYVLFTGITIVMVIEGLEILEIFYKAREGVETVKELIEGPIWAGMVIQWAMSVFVLSVTSALLIFDVHGKRLVNWLFMSALAIMIGVLAMRWNVVIGGQELSKTMKGLLTFYPELFGRESLFTVLMISICPYVLLWLVTKVLPPWADNRIEPEHHKEIGVPQPA
ncbi:MAG: NrfD/PsrC family molybdoenzyme membrane anchor subunit [Gallionella sp.]